jgi:hypothetical protein
MTVNTIVDFDISRNPSYFRIQLSQPDAMLRLASWLDSPELEPPREVRLSDAVTFACDNNGHWRGSALYIYNNDGWTVFEDLSGHFSSIPADSWLTFAQSDNFVFAGYNDAIGYGELIVIEGGAVVREFPHGADNPDVKVNRGQLDGNPIESIETWIQAARFVDDDVIFSEHGLLWLHGKAT